MARSGLSRRGSGGDLQRFRLIVQAHIDETTAQMAGTVLGGSAFGLLFVFDAGGFTDSHSAAMVAQFWLPVLIVVACFDALVFAVFLARGRRRLFLDLRSAEVVRATGVLEAYEFGDEGVVRWGIRLDAKRLPSPWGDKQPPFDRVPMARVECTRNAHVVLAIHDDEGRVVYRHPWYSRGRER